MVKWRCSSFVGVELDDGIIRAVELSGRAGSVSLEAAGRITLTQNAVQNGAVHKQEAVEEALQKLWATANIRSRRVVLGVFNHNVLLRLLNLPQTPKHKLKQAILWQADNYLPLPRAEMVLDAAVLRESEEGMSEVILVAAKKVQLQKNVAPFSSCNLLPQVVDVQPLALLRLLTPAMQNGAIVMLDLALGLNSLVVAVNGRPRFACILPHNLQQYLQQIELSGGVSQVSAAVFSLEQSANPLVEESLFSWYKAVAAELHTTIAYYLAQHAVAKIDKIYLSGCGATIQGVKVYLQKTMGVTVETIQPAANLSVRNKELRLKVNSPEFAVCTGLALYGWEG